MESLSWTDFQKPEHQTLFRHLCSISNIDWDIIPIGQSIRDSGLSVAIGGAEYLLEILNSDYGTARVGYFIKEVKKTSLDLQRKALIARQAVSKIDHAVFVSELNKISAEIEKLDANPCSIALRVFERIESNINNPNQTLTTPWRRLDSLSQYTMAGTVCLLCGNVGAAKSFMALQIASHLLEQGIKFSVFELEDTSDFHIMRSVAQRLRMSGLTSPEWCRANPDHARMAHSEIDFVNAIGVAMTDSPDVLPTLDKLSLWAENKAAEGSRLLIIDPVSLAKKTSERIWKEDEKFVDEIKKIAAKHAISIILVTHPIKQCTFPDVSQLSGGVVYSRACHTILWLQNHEPLTSEILTDCGTDSVDHTRTLHILKARNGCGQGKRLAFELDKESLCLKEIGVIVKKAKK
jgi:replicative DNA helicase